jgi:hypothetical protein
MRALGEGALRRPRDLLAHHDAHGAADEGVLHGRDHGGEASEGPRRADHRVEHVGLGLAVPEP